jgi:hypothetical protein
MIFLAVTLGFFAESIRENISNRHKESKYMESLVSEYFNKLWTFYALAKGYEKII